MKRKHWGILTAVGFGEMLLSDALLWLGAPRRPMRFLLLGGTAVLFFGMLGFVVYSSRHPAWLCPHCGKGLTNRNLRPPGNGKALGGDGKTVICPHCGVMLHSYDLKKAE